MVKLISTKLKLITCDHDGVVCLNIPEKDKKIMAEIIDEIIELETQSFEWGEIIQKKDEEIVRLNMELNEKIQ